MSNKFGLKVPSKILKLANSNKSPSFSSALSSSTHSISSVDTSKSPNEHFSIGDRVWINGKTGVIHYLGTTKFAPGDWAGIVLDEPIGKNNGTVDGVKYFECEPLHGLFAKTSKLSKHPLSPPANGSKTPGRGSFSQSSPLNSTKTTPSISRFRIGDRVSVSSSTGTKIGTLRYLGPTEFAEGEWAGVELDEPTGKNDGSVAGKRYFTCAPMHGLFALVYKVSKAPPKSLHHGSSLNSNKMITGSLESLNSSISSTSSITRNRVKLGINSLNQNKPKPSLPRQPSINDALKDALREKEEHIEKLLLERNEDQVGAAKAAAKVVELKGQISHMENELHKLLEEKIIIERELRHSLSAKQKENDLLIQKLEEEQRKVEDLQFRLEEESINKVDLADGKVAELQEELFKKDELLLKLESQIESQRQEINTVSMRLEDANVKLVKILEENKSLKEENSYLTEQVNFLKHSLDKEREHILEKECKGFSRHQSHLDSDLDMQEKIDALNTEISLKDELCHELEKKIIHYENKFSEMYKSNHSSQSAQELEHLQMLLEETKKDVTSWQHKCEELEAQSKKLLTENETLEKSLHHVRHALEEQESKFLQTKTQSQELINTLKSELAEIQTKMANLLMQRDSLIEENQKLEKTAQERLAQERSALMEEKQKAVARSEEQLKTLTSQLLHFQKQFQTYKEELNEKLQQSQQESQAIDGLKQRIDELNHKLEATTKKLESVTKEKSELQEVLDHLHSENHMLKNQVSSLQNQLEITQAREQELSTVCDQQKSKIQENLNLISQLEKQQSSLPDYSKDPEFIKLIAEKRNLEQRLVEMQVALAQVKENESGGKDDRETLQNQIDFLNSVIVDMHRKNDQLKTQLELLERENESEYAINGGTTQPKKPPPRVFCDICERFDVHDTEECPSQRDSKAEIESIQKSSQHRWTSRSEPRPYCEHCEIFGHWTQDCQNTETY